MEERLSEKRCKPCEGGTPPLSERLADELREQLDEEWRLIDTPERPRHHLERTFRFPSYRDAIAFVNAVADVAEEQQHHPVLEVGYAQVVVRLWTHKMDGLSENDFIMASKLDEVSRGAVQAP